MDYGILTFYSTHLTLRFEQVTKEKNIPHRLIPVPREISSSCGIAGRVEARFLPQVLLLCKQEELPIEGVFLQSGPGAYKEVPK